MKRKKSILNLAGILFSLVLMGASLISQAAPPQTMNYQAYLKDSGGLPVNSTKNITFRIYDALAEGTLVWTETLVDVVIVDGLFSVELGTTSPLPKVLMDNPLWLSIEIEADGEASPRTALLSTNNAFRAEDSDTLQGQTAASLNQSAQVVYLQTRVGELENEVEVLQGQVTNVIDRLANSDFDNDGFTPSSGDCDDADDQVYPGAAEITGDGIDNDCDALTPDGVDADADGYYSTASGGADCDDTNAAVNPGMAEITGDGIDNDCDALTVD